MCLTAVRVSAAELALFHTGAILSSVGHCSPATATLEHLREDKCLFYCVCVCACVLSSCFRQYLCHGPPLHPHPRSLSASTTVHLARDLVANPLRCVSCNFPLCWDIFVFFCQFFFTNFSWMLSGLVQRFVEAFVNSNWAFVVKGFELKSLLLIQHCFSPRNATDTHRKMGASRHSMLALYEILLRPSHTRKWHSKTKLIAVR